MDGKMDCLGSFSLLDGREVPRSWHSALATALLRVFQELSWQDREILAPLNAFMAEHAAEFATLETDSAGRTIEPPEGIQETHPVSSTLLALRKERSSRGLIRLTAILVSAAIEQFQNGGSRNRVASLSENIRGAIQNPKSGLRVLLSNPESIPELVGVVQDHCELSRRPLHASFENLWRSWLGNTLRRWMLADPALLRHALEPRNLVPSIDSPTIPLGVDPAVDPEDQLQLNSMEIEGAAPGENEANPKVRRARAESNSLIRGSNGDLFTPPDLMVPEELISKLAALALKEAEAQLKLPEGHAPNMSAAALVFAMASGLREIDLPDIIWGRGDQGRFPELDPEQPVLYRRIQRPPNAVRPSVDMQQWLEISSDVLAWPIPERLYKCLRATAPLSGPVVGAPVLQSRVSSLYQVVARLLPGSNMGAGRFRIALAAHIGRTLGPEVAQQALGDTFSMSTSPAYYSAVPEARVAEVAAEVQRRWFNQDIALPSGRKGFIGSRLVLTDLAAEQWPASLNGNMRRSRRAKGDGFEEWVAHRDHLAGALCAITGHRPIDAIGQIRLDDIIPEYGLIILTDKQSDALRSTRIAATGKRWLSALRAYLDRLATLSKCTDADAMATHARSVLLSESPLFSLCRTDGAVVQMDAATLRSTMPPAFQSVANHYRHRLNQFLQKRDVDPEVRHGQLGWIVSPAHFTSDMAPLPPKALNELVGPLLDELVVNDGWYPRTQRITRWHWNEVPSRPLKDWVSVLQQHRDLHEAQMRDLKGKLQTRGESATKNVLPRLALAFKAYVPRLRLDEKTRRLELISDGGHSDIVNLSADLQALICDRVRQSDQNQSDALEAVVTKTLLYKLVRSARERGIVRGPIPSRPRLSVTSELSPFPLTIGLAVRHAEALRACLLDRTRLQKPGDQGFLALMAVLALSPYRDIQLASAAVNGAAGGSRSVRPGDWIRIPAVVDRKEVSMIFSGVPALLLSRRGTTAATARCPSVEKLESWIHEHLKPPFELKIDAGSLAEAVVGIFRIAGLLELSGPERMVMQNEVILATVSTERTLAQDNDWPVQTSSGSKSDVPDTSSAVSDEGVGVAKDSKARHRSATEGYERFTQCLNPDASQPKIQEGTATPQRSESPVKRREWRGKVKKRLSRLRMEAGERTNLGLLIGFSLHRLIFGGKKRKKLARKTLHNEVTRFGRALLEIAGSLILASANQDEVRRLYLAVLLSKPKSSRSQVLDALRMFHRYLQQVHGVPEVSFGELASLAGRRPRFVDTGMITDIEIRRTYCVLEKDLADESVRDNASPDLIRQSSLRMLLFLLLEASGVRPGSAWGLTLGDIHLSDHGRDFLHIHKTGEYGAAKSQASIGFVPLEGSFWQEKREWIVEWLRSEQHKLAGTAWWNAPIFALDPGNRARYALGHLSRRFDALLKWVCSEKKAKTYWLRKNRITIRHRTAAALEHPSARSVYAAMCASGHAGITTPLENYIFDPAVAMSASIREARGSSRAWILVAGNLDGPTMDMAWQRRRAAGNQDRLTVAMDRMDIACIAARTEYLTVPPVLARKKKLLPQDLDGYARSMHRYLDRSYAIQFSGLTDRQSETLDETAEILYDLRGQMPWRIAHAGSVRPVMTPPRPLAGTGKLHRLLECVPDADLELLADEWARQGFAGIKMNDSTILMKLRSRELIAAASRLIDRTGARLEIHEDPAERSYAMLRTTADGRQGHGGMFHWVMAINWIFLKSSLEESL